MRKTAKEMLKTVNGTATKDGRTYSLVDRCTLPDPLGEGRAINAVDGDAVELDAGYFPMTLLRLPPRWARGGEVTDAVPNGEYDWIMREQKGVLTAPRGYCGARCHDC